MELTVDTGKGYVLPDKQDKSKQIIGVIPIGAAFTPVRKVVLQRRGDPRRLQDRL